MDLWPGVGGLSARTVRTYTVKLGTTMWPVSLLSIVFKILHLTMLTMQTSEACHYHICIAFIPRLGGKLWLLFCSCKYLYENFNPSVLRLFRRPTFTHVWGPRHQTSSRCWIVLDPMPRRRRWRPSRNKPLLCSSCWQPSLVSVPQLTFIVNVWCKKSKMRINV